VATIISHRGWWTTRDERNAPVAFERSFAADFGTETDVRDDRGRLVIAHDPPAGGEPTLDDVLALHRRHGAPGPLALNVKADGLQDLLAAAVAAHDVPDWFAFDMAVPDAVGYAARGLPFFTRHSEHEPHPALYEPATGVWIDCFERDWLDEPGLRAHLDAGKRACLVSPELHGRDPEPAWRAWAGWDALRSPGAIVCTDRPDALAEVLR
jgi:hypothetical protein